MTTPTPSEYRHNMPESDQSKFFKNSDGSTLYKADNTIDISITTSEGIPTSPPVQNQTPFMAAKPHMVPVVYLQTPNTTTKPNTNMVFNTVQISNLGHNINNMSAKNGNLPTTVPLPTNLSVQNNQGVILTKPQQLVLQKQSGTPLVPISVANNSSLKSTVALLTMIKSMPSKPEVIATNRVQINPLSTTRTDNIQIIPNMASINPNPGQKYLLTPMPKISSNRLPVTATTNCNIQSKIAFMPLTLPNKVNPDSIANKHKVFNFKISNGQVQNDGPITVLCDTPSEQQNLNVPTEPYQQNEKNLICTETINIDSPEKKRKENEDKSYQLSIVEDSSSRNDVSYTISIPDDPEKYKQDQPIKETPKYAKQGISILKRSFTPVERKNNLIINSVPNSITTISDANTKEVKITTFTNFDNDEPVVVNTPLPKIQAKPERRRKANFSYRKDYDEVEVSASVNWDSKVKFDKLGSSDVTFTKLNCSEPEVQTQRNMEEDLMEVEVIKERFADMNDNFDEVKVLNWESGLGALPGSQLRFQMNEFGILEIVSDDDVQKLIEKHLTKNKENKVKNDYQEELRCLECGCFGLPSEFITSKYCSYDCQEAGEKYSRDKENKLKKKKKKGICKKSFDGNPNERESGSDEENTSNENSQDKLAYPWSCTKKGFSWPKYLDHMKAKAAPTKLFKDPFPYGRNGFRAGMKLEGIDPQHPKYFCVLTVSEVLGYRIRLHFDGYPENYDFWINADSMDIFPIGWCEKNGHHLHTPPNYGPEEFNWNNYLKQTKSTAAPKQLFAVRAPNHCPNAFRVGMKLEAVDRKNTSLVCVATIADMMDNRILVHFDSWDDIYDYWAEPTSPYIHPVGWCDQYGHNLTPPNDSPLKLRQRLQHCLQQPNMDYPHPESFTWESYLRETKSVAAPVRAFKQKPANGFKRGMKLECVDKRVPHLIRVATVDDVREHQIRIKFDGWPDKYSYWVDDDSADIHPIGWCHKTGHPLEPPLTPDDVYDFLECATVGCRGQGHIKGPKYPTHTSPKYCPYADENIDMERTLPDRLLSPDREIESVVPVSREPKENVKIRRVGRPPKVPRLDVAPIVKSECLDDEEEDVDRKPKRKYRKSKTPTPEVKITPNVSDNGFVHHPDQSLVLPQNWMKHSKYLRPYIKVDSDPREWSEYEVLNFVKNIPSCQQHGEQFIINKIDGDSMLMLSQEDIINVLDVKIGPAVKLYNSIILLRENILKDYT